jgi:outer membrane protein assembly factor BamB
MKRTIAALFISVTVAGCGTFQQITSQVIPAKDSNSPKALKEFKPTANVRTLWQANTGSNTGKDYVRINPYVDAAAVLVAGGHSASAWNKTNGGRIWQTPIDEEITGGVSAGDGSVFLGTGNGNAIALDYQTGKVRWSKPLNSEVLAVSPVHNGVVAFRTSDGKLSGLSTQTGETLWQQIRQSPVLSLRGAGTPVVVGDMIIAGFDSGVVTAFDMQSGRALWEVPLSVPRGSSDIDSMTDVDGKLKPLGEALFAASYNGQIVGINMRNGSIGWSAPYSSYSGVDADQNGLYTSSAEGDVWKLDPQTGHPIWKLDDLEHRQPTAPTLQGNYIVSGDAEGYLHWINTNSGQIAARIRGDAGGYTVAPVQDGNVIYTFGRNGLLSAFTLQ